MYIVVEDLDSGRSFNTSLGKDHAVLAGAIFWYTQADEYHDATLRSTGGPLKHDVQFKVCFIDCIMSSSILLYLTQ